MTVFHCTNCAEGGDGVTLVIPSKLLPDRLTVDCPVCGGPLVRECTCGENDACSECGDDERLPA